MSNFIVFWNKVYNKFPNYIHESSELDFVFDSFKDFKSSEEFNNSGNFDLQKINANKGIIILCELKKDINDNPAYYQNFAGIEIAKEFRKAGVNIPILFVSAFSRKFIYERNKSENASITTIGSIFIRLKAKDDIEEWTKSILNYRQDGSFINTLGLEDDDKKKIRNLDSLEMYDIQSSYCNNAGYIRTSIHQLNGEIDNNKIKEKVYELCSLVGENSEKWISKLDGYTEIEDQKKNVPLGDSKRSILAQLESYLLDKDNSSDENAKNQPIYNWKMIILDDKHEQLEGVITEIKKRLDKKNNNSIQVITCKTAAEAFEELNKDFKDFRNDVQLIVCDYRLLETMDGIEIHQDIQGYKFLKTVSMTGRLISFAVFSSLPRHFLLKSLKEFGIRAEAFSKLDYDLLDTNKDKKNYAINRIVNEFIRLGNENFEMNMNMPSSVAWQKWEPFYKIYRSSKNYAFDELRLSKKAKGLIDEFKLFGKFNENLSLSKSTKISPTNVNINLRNLKDVMLGRRLWIGLEYLSMEKIKINENEFVIKNIKQLEVLLFHTIDEIDLKEITTFADKFENFPIDSSKKDNFIDSIKELNIDKKLKKGILDRFEKMLEKPSFNISTCDQLKDFLNPSNKFINNMGINRDDFPFGLLQEEMNWLFYEMGYKNLYKDLAYNQYRLEEASLVIEDYLNNPENIKLKVKLECALVKSQVEGEESTILKIPNSANEKDKDTIAEVIFHGMKPKITAPIELKYILDFIEGKVLAQLDENEKGMKNG